MRGRGFGMTMSGPQQQFTCPELGGRNFFPPQGWGWGVDYPGADCKFMRAVQRLTGIRVHPDPNVIAIMDNDLFRSANGTTAADARSLSHVLRRGRHHADPEPGKRLQWWANLGKRGRYDAWNPWDFR